MEIKRAQSLNDLDLANEEVFNDLPGSPHGGTVQSHVVQGRGKGISVTKRQHQWYPTCEGGASQYTRQKQKTRQPEQNLTPSVFESPASFVHLVLPCHAPFHEVDIAGSIDRLCEFAGLKDPLLALEDVEVVVSGVKTTMSFGSEWGAEND